MTDVDSAHRADVRTELSRLRLPELQALAAERGIVGAAKLRKGELVDTLSETEGAGSSEETLAPIDTLAPEGDGQIVQDLAPADDAAAEPRAPPPRRRPAARAA